MTFLRFALPLLAAVAWSGCATPGRAYASRHPELPAAHRQILVSGQVPGGDAIAGMTREQVTLALGAAARFDNINGQDAWIYAGRPAVSTTGQDLNNAPSSSFSRTQHLPDPADAAEGEVYTTVFFRGDRATHAQVGATKP